MSTLRVAMFQSLEMGQRLFFAPFVGPTDNFSKNQLESRNKAYCSNC